MRAPEPSDRAPFLALSPDARVADDVLIGAGVVIYGCAEIGPGCEIQDQAVIGKPPRLGPRSRGGRPDDDAAVLVAAGAVVCTGAILTAGAHVARGAVIGDRARLREGAAVGAGSMLGACVALGPAVIVGERVRIFPNTVLAARTVVEDEADLSIGVATVTRGWGKADAPGDGPLLGRRCRIGVNAVVFGGVEVGEGAVVGAAAVVREDVPAGVTVAGVPAKPLPAGGAHPDR